MSFHVIGAVLKSQASNWTEKVAARFRGSPKRFDKDLPLGLTIGGGISFDEAAFIIWEEDLAISCPGQNCMITAIGISKLGQHTIYRAYLDDNRSVVQVSPQMQRGKTGVDITLFQHFDEIHPANRDEWEFWLSHEDGSIGLDVFETRDGVQYGRSWLPGAPHVEPIRYSEYIHMDPSGENVHTAQHQSMLYSRDANGESEQMLISAVESGGGPVSGAWVELSVGVDLKRSMIDVL